jgi:predicted transcriptional regulator
VLALYDAYRKTQTNVLALTEQVSDEASVLLDFESHLPAEQVSDFIQENANHFPDIEAEAERIRAEAGLGSADPFAAIAQYANVMFAIRVAILPPALGVETARRYDATNRTLEISELLPTGS